MLAYVARHSAGARRESGGDAFLIRGNVHRNARHHEQRHLLLFCEQVSGAWALLLEMGTIRIHGVGVRSSAAVAIEEFGDGWLHGVLPAARLHTGHCPRP